MDDTTPLPGLEAMARALGGDILNGQVLAPGPGHSAADRSLAVRPDPSAPDGFLTFSFANDDAIQCRDYVRQRCGLPAFKPNGRRQRASSAEIAELMASAIAGQRRGTKRVLRRHDYLDENGALLHQVERLEQKRPGDPKFRRRRPDGNGGWIYDVEDVRRVPYRLPELLRYSDGTAFVCEGEKDADSVAVLGHCATCVASGKWTEDIVIYFKSRDVIILQDADEAGRQKALMAATALHGTAATIRIVLLPGLTGHPNNKDVSDWLAADPNRANKFVDVCFDAPIWQPGQDDEPIGSPLVQNSGPLPTSDTSIAGAEPVSDETASTTVKEPPPPPALDFIDLTRWEGQPIPERQWAVLDRVPHEEVTLVSGEGAVGKSLVLKQLAVATVTGKDWLGTMPTPGPVIYVTAEEKVDELHYRLRRIIEHYSVRFADLGDLHIRSMKGEDTILAYPNRNGIIRPTPLFERLLEAVLTIKPRWVGLDPVANLFAGNENNRSQVQQFIALLTQIAVQANTAVILVSHPSLTGINTGSGISGSTAWHNSVRSRLYLKKAATEKGETPDPDLRVFEILKNNYGPPAEAITLRWSDGLFLPMSAPGSLEKLAREQKVGELFLMLLDHWNDQGRPVNDKKTSNTYAPNRFVDEPEAKADHVSKRELAEAMERLLRAGKIHVVPYGYASRGWTRLERK
jgi:RecA-family ATPase